MKRKLGVVATAVLLGGFVSTNAFAAGGGGPAGGQAGAIAGRASMGAVSRGGVVGGGPAGGQAGAIAGTASVGAVSRGGVGLSAGSPMPFIPLITPSNGGALPIGQGLGGGAGSPTPFLTLMPRSIYSVPLSTGASSLYSTPINSSQPAVPQANISSNAAPQANISSNAAPQANISSNGAPSQSGQGGTPYQGTVISVAGRGTRVLQPQNVSLPRAQDQRNENRTNLKAGARVRLRSGGPLMAVLSVSGTDVTCVWFNAARQAETGTFPAASLM
jgi:uncharacterized protein YodC (DUF2158 family)